MRSDDSKFWPKPLAVPEGCLSPAGHRASRMRDSLKDLRRVRRASDGSATGDAAAAAAAPDPDIPMPTTPEPPEKEESQEEALIHATLRELNDSVESLSQLEEQLKQGLDPVKESGGARHATAVISARTLAVVHRKRVLMGAVSDRIEKLEALQEEFDDLLPLLMSGELKEAPEEMRGIRKFVEKYTHTPGDPADANKSDFKAFVATFKLPYWHSALTKLRSLMGAVGEWWADACLAEAEKGATHDVLERLFTVAISTGLDKEHHKLLRAMKILSDRLADRVLREAQELLEKDKLMASQQRVPPVGPASAAATSIEDTILRAVADGVPESDPRLTEAGQIVKKLRENDQSRKRLANRDAKMKAVARMAALGATAAANNGNAGGGNSVE